MAEKRSILGRAVARSVRGTVLTIAVAAFGAYAIVYVVRMAKAPPDAAPEAKTEAPAPSGLFVVLNHDDQRKGGIEAAPIRSVAYQRDIWTFGTVLATDRMASLYNESLATEAQLRSSQAKLSASKAANDRAQKLLKVFNTAVAQAEAADEAYKVDAAGVDAVQAQIDALGNTAVQEWGPVLGEAIVKRSALADRLVRRQSALIQLSLQPGANAAPPQSISVGLTGKASVSADYVSVATSADPKIQNSAFFYVAPATSWLLPGMDLLARLPIGKAEPGLAIPASAIVWQGGRAWVYLRVDAQQFERRPIEKDAIATDDGGFVAQAASLPRGQEIVIQGAQALLSEETRSKFSAAEDD